MRRIVIAASALVILLLVAGILFLNLRTPAVDQFEETLQFCEGANTDRYHFMVALRDSNAAACGNIRHEPHMKLCTAMVTKDTGMCEPDNGTSFCRALVEQNPALCPDDLDFCMARASGDTSLCQGDEVCIARVTHNADYFSAPERETECLDDAYLADASALRDSAICGKITHEPRRAYCVTSLS